MAPKVRERAVRWLRQLFYFVVEPAGSRVITPYDFPSPHALHVKLERETGFEPATKSLGSSYATTALLPHSICILTFSEIVVKRRKILSSF